VDQPKNSINDPLHVRNGPMTWFKIKTLKEALNALVLKIATKSELKGPMSIKRRPWYILSMCKRGPIQPYLGMR
jgi:hypothetical protein